MEKEFVPYELALKLRELGFDEECLAGYYFNGKKLVKGSFKNPEEFSVAAPLWQQAFDWFHKEHNLFAEFSFNTLRSKYDWCIPVNINKGYCSQEEYDTYEEARLECLRKLIKIIEDEKSN